MAQPGEKFAVGARAPDRSVQFAAHSVAEALYLSRADAEVYKRLPPQFDPGLELRLHRLVHAETHEVFELLGARRTGDDADVGVEDAHALHHEPRPDRIRYREYDQARLPHPGRLQHRLRGRITIDDHALLLPGALDAPGV